MGRFFWLSCEITVCQLKLKLAKKQTNKYIYIYTLLLFFGDVFGLFYTHIYKAGFAQISL